MPPSRRDALLALALLASAPLVFGLFIRNAFPPQGPWEWTNGQMQGPPAALFWPTLLLWQDLCRSGVWGCPAG